MMAGKGFQGEHRMRDAGGRLQGKVALVVGASDESRMITGAAIPADGGRSAY